MEETRKNGMLVDVDEFPKSWGHAWVLAIQHVLAMFVALRFFEVVRIDCPSAL